MKNNRSEKEKILGQFFTKEIIIEKLLDILFKYKNYDKNIKIIEPSFGTGNFIKVLKRRGFIDIDGCEIDEELTEEPKDFFNYPIEQKYDLIIGNPPFTKYNIKESYYFLNKYKASFVIPENYLTKKILRKKKEKIENVFILKSLKHLKDKNSSIGFVLPISFFIKNKNKDVKIEILKYFSTIIIYQNNKVWFDYHIPCCFTIFTNSNNFKNKIILYFDNEIKNRQVISINRINEELIPQLFFNKKNGVIKNNKGKPLSDFLKKERIKYKTSYTENNVSAKNILDKTLITDKNSIEAYKLAVVRVGNASVGKCGLVNIKTDILNEMFYVFDFKEKYNKNKKNKERICKEINRHQDYFKNITCRVGSKSIKKEDILNFKIKI